MSESEALEPLPAAVPVFPLIGAVLLPRGVLPLNIFEPRYLAMVKDAMAATGAANRTIGMIQPRRPKEAERVIRRRSTRSAAWAGSPIIAKPTMAASSSRWSASAASGWAPNWSATRSIAR